MNDMKALVIYESMFGNTARIAQAVADSLASEGIETTLMQAAEAGTRAVDGMDLLVVGAPTHGLTLSTPSSRTGARARGAAVAPEALGVREWLASSGATAMIAAFDTRSNRMRHWPGSAARKIARTLRGRGMHQVARPASFYVLGTVGPLVDGEIDRARGWGTSVARASQRDR